MGIPQTALELAPGLRNAWIEQHSRYREAHAELEHAEIRAARPERTDDPIKYVNNSFNAHIALQDAKRHLSNLRAELGAQYDRILRG